jgi:hypothetical protein
MLSSLVFYVYSRTEISNIYKSNQRVLSTISRSANYLDLLGTSYCSTMFSNYNVRAFMFNKGSNAMLGIEAMNFLNNFHSSAPFLKSVYIYNGNRDIFASDYNGTIQKSDDL